MGVKVVILAEILLVFEENIFANLSNHTDKYIERLQPLFLSPRGNIALYSFRAAEAMPLMEQVGRLREEAFRAAGGGTGRAMDIDEHDLASDGYRQLVAWDVAARRIVGGYRYIVGAEDFTEHISTLKYFQPSDAFCSHILPRAIELGRSFVSCREGYHSLFAMDALWHGLAQIAGRLPKVEFLFGKVTIYPQFDALSRDAIRLFLKRFHPARRGLLRPRQPLPEPSAGIACFEGDDYAENYVRLTSFLRSRGERIPPMLHAYMRLTRGMQSFGTILNPDFGNTFETAILLPLSSINTPARERYFQL